MHNKALICMDFQNDIVHPDGILGRNGIAQQVNARRLAENVANVRAAARHARIETAHIRVAYRPDYKDMASVSTRARNLKNNAALVENEWGSAFDSRFLPEAEDVVFTKRCVNPFFESGLLPWLYSHRIGQIYLCGVATNMVVESAARFADDAGLEVSVIEDCCASFSQEMHDFSVANILPLLGRVLSADQVVVEFKSA